MVIDLADEPLEDHVSVTVADDKPTIVDLEEEAAGMQECRYCGYYPCGCGG